MASRSEGRRSPDWDRPNMRVVLLGNSVSENSQVGNFILGRAAFDGETFPDVAERVTGRLKERHVMVINSPHLLQTNISDHKIKQTVRECVHLSDPGPHVIILLLKHKQCSAEYQECVEKVLHSFSERVFQHTMVLTMTESTQTNDILQKIIKKCLNRHFILQRNSSPDDLLQMFEDIMQMNDGHHLVCAEVSQHFKMATEKYSESVKLNLVVCGSDATLKSSISEQILQQADRRSDVELHRCQMSLVELPVLFNTQLSEEKMMHQIISCVSLCHPGVHVFLLIILDSPLTDEDKTEIEQIQNIFGSRVNKYLLILRVQHKDVSRQMNLVHPSATEMSIQTYGGRQFILEDSSQVPDLLQDVENMVQENRGSSYTTFMFLQAQLELEKNKHSAEIEEVRRSMMKTKS
ncbi:hypothetical protein QQF64_023956, partial [Cirrhinus molitorella]